MAKKRIIRDFRLDKIAAVDRPCQQGAKMTIMKRADLMKLDADLAPIVKYISASEGAQPFQTFLSQAEQRDKHYDLVEQFQSELCALDNSLRSIVGDAEMSQERKPLAMRESIEAFMTSVRDKWPDIPATVAKAVEYFTDLDNEGENPMSKELETKLADLEKSVADLTAERDEAVAKAAEQEVIAKMTDDEKDYLKSLDGEAKKEFMAMSADDRKKKMKKAAEADETLEVDGETVRKSIVGDEAFKLLVSMNKRTEALAKDQADASDKAAIAKAEQRAQAEFSHLPGSVEERGAMLKAMEDMDEDLRKSFEAVFTAAEGLAKGAFKQVGSQGQEINKADQDKFVAKVSEIQDRDKISKSAAMVKAAAEFPELHKAYAGQAN